MSGRTLAVCVTLVLALVLGSWVALYGQQFKLGDCVTPGFAQANKINRLNFDCDGMRNCLNATSELCGMTATNCPNVGTFNFRSIEIDDILDVGFCASYAQNTCNECQMPNGIVCLKKRAWGMRNAMTMHCENPCNDTVYEAEMGTCLN